MSASQPINVAAKNADAIYPDYEGFGQILTFNSLGSVKNIRLGRCIRAPTVKDLLSVSALAEKGHKCTLRKNNPRIIPRLKKLKFCMKKTLIRPSNVGTILYFLTKCGF